MMSVADIAASLTQFQKELTAARVRLQDAHVCGLGREITAQRGQDVARLLSIVVAIREELALRIATFG